MKLNISMARKGIEQRFWRLAQTLAINGVTSVLEDGFWTKEWRDSYLKTARERGFQIELRVLYVPKDETRKRLNARGMEGDALIVREKLNEYYKVFEIPTDEELKQYDNWSKESLASTRYFGWSLVYRLESPIN